MQPVMFESIINQMLPQLSWLTLYFQGEPYMSNHFFGFIKYARSKKIFVATSTNGHFLDEGSVHQTIESGLNRLIISLDGADQQRPEHDQQRRSGADRRREVRTLEGHHVEPADDEDDQAERVGDGDGWAGHAADRGADARHAIEADRAVEVEGPTSQRAVEERLV